MNPGDIRAPLPTYNLGDFCRKACHTHCIDLIPRPPQFREFPGRRPAHFRIFVVAVADGEVQTFLKICV